MGFMQMLTDNFWAMVALLLFIISIVSIVLGIALEAYKSSMKARQKMLELRNEELRLQLQLQQQRNGLPREMNWHPNNDEWHQLQQQRSGPLPTPPSTNIPMPKDSTWAENEQSGYQLGY